MSNEDKLRRLLKETAAELGRTRQRLTEAEQRQVEPIAIIGMACRYPGGVGSPEQLWDLVEAGTDAIGPFPADRGWLLDDLGPVEGGFLYDAGEFDAEFFGISPKEALAMDPQQRLMLETAWEAIERAGIAPSSLTGSRTDVLIGASPTGYMTAIEQGGEATEGYAVTGGAMALVSGRISYALNLTGSAVTVDTACSSSLVALDMAIRSLRAAECDLALAGGVAVMPVPGPFIAFARQGGLAVDGRCKAFSDKADGTGWSEGAGVLLLERLSDARRHGHPVLAVVRGSAINSDGASNGVSAPNGLAQRAVIQQALANAGLAPADVDVVEAHGTGTTLGDPIEAQALLATYGAARGTAEPVYLGTVKSNLGHTQAAAGIAGVIKMVMAMRHHVLPATLHADPPSSHVDWSTGSVSLLSQRRRWPETGRPRRAAVSSFGISGTNAHLILEEPPAPEPARPPAPDGNPLPWMLSARSEAALRAQADKLLAHLSARPHLDISDVAGSLVTTRTAFDHRAVITGGRRAHLMSGLESLARGEPTPAVVTGVARSGGRTAVLFPGQGAQRAGMGRTLHERFAVFAKTFDAVAERFDAALGTSLKDAVFGDGETEASALDETGLAQPALFTYEVALYRLCESFGLTADFVLGHSLGEITAAHVAGVLSIDDAVTLVAARGTLMQQLPRSGVMLAVRSSEQDVRTVLRGLDGRVDIAAVNGPTSVVLSGDQDAVARAESVFVTQGWKTSRLRVSHAFHSALMDPMLDRFADVVAGLSFASPEVGFVSSTLGRLATSEDLADVEYWLANVRRTVRFADGIEALERAGASTYLEVGPEAVAIAMAQDCVLDWQRSAFVATQKRGRDQYESLVEALAETYVHGGEVNWSELSTEPTSRVDLPTYAFQRKRYWLTVTYGNPAAGPTSELDRWRYGLRWHRLADAPSAELDGSWLLVVAADDPAEDVARVLTEHGARVVTLEMTALDRAGLAARLRDLPDRPRGVVSLLSDMGRWRGHEGTHPKVRTGCQRRDRPSAWDRYFPSSDMGRWRGHEGTHPKVHTG